MAVLFSHYFSISSFVKLKRLFKKYVKEIQIQRGNIYNIDKVMAI